jgi:hypothetical protein
MTTIFWWKCLLGLARSVDLWRACALGSVGGSSSGGISGSSTNTSSVPQWLKQYDRSFVPVGQSLLAQYQGVNGPQTTAAGNVLSNDLAGYYLNPATNPTLQPTIAGIENEASTNLGTELEGINAGANANGMLLSSKALQNADQAAVTSQQGVTAQVANLLSNQYNQGFQAQQQAVNPAINLGQLPLATTQSILEMLMGGQKNQSGTSYDQQNQFSASYGAPASA